ncbi:MAG: hypothetical protein ABIH66_06630, partial [bacterium]
MKLVIETTAKQIAKDSTRGTISPTGTLSKDRAWRIVVICPTGSHANNSIEIRKAGLATEEILATRPPTNAPTPIHARHRPHLRANNQRQKRRQQQDTRNVNDEKGIESSR